MSATTNIHFRTMIPSNNNTLRTQQKKLKILMKNQNRYNVHEQLFVYMPSTQ